MTLLQDEALAMFFDDDFSPSNYVDALFQSIIGETTPENRYSKQNLSRLSNKLLDLTTHLDYHTNELSKELASKIDTLRKLSASVVAMDYEQNGSDETSRLQYYISSLKNSVDTLQGDVAAARQQLVSQKHVAESDPVETLIQLKIVRENILKVLSILQNARKMVAGGSETVNVDEFLNTLNFLFETLKTRLKESENDGETLELQATIQEMRSWAPMFQPFTNFGAVYLKFVTRLEGET